MAITFKKFKPTKPQHYIMSNVHISIYAHVLIKEIGFTSYDRRPN